MAEEMAGKHSSRKLAQRRLLRAATGGVAALLVCAASASAKSYVPPSHKIFHGVSDTTDNADFYRFAQRVRAHPAVLEDFYHWDTPLTTGALDRWAATRTRGVLSLSTAPGGEAERISPRAVAQGRGDRYILRLNQSIAASKQVVYIRLFPEMNGYWNPYSAFNESGSSRGRSHSTSSFRQAWQRVVLIMRGGKLREINRELRERGMPRLLRAESSQDPVYETESVHGGRLARLLAREAVRRLGRRRHLLGIWHPRRVGGVRAVLPEVARVSVRGWGVLTVEQRLQGALHAQAVPMGRAPRPCAHAHLLPQR